MKSTLLGNTKLRRAIRGTFMGATMAIVAGSAALAPPPAKAQWAVECVNCSDIFTQIMEFAKQLLQYAKQLDQYAKQLEDLQNQIKNTAKLPNLIMDRALNTVRGIENTMSMGTNIRYTMSNIDSELFRLYPDVYSQINRLRGRRGNSFNARWQSISDQWLSSLQNYDATRTLLKAAQRQSMDIDADQWRMDMVEGQLSGADGRMGALQAAGAYAQQSAQQMIKLRQIALMQLQVAAQNEADKARLRDIQKAERQLWTEKPPSNPYTRARRYWWY